MTNIPAHVLRKLEIIIALTATVLLLAFCGTAAPRSENTAQPHEHNGAPAPITASEFSVYDLPAAWRDAGGVERTLASLAGRPQVVAMVYTQCAYVCPRILADMKRLEGELGPAADVGFVLVSIDPSRDTPQRLAEYAAATRMDARRWTLLTGADDGVQELAALLGVRYRRVSETEFEHSNVLTVLDASGAIVHRQVGLGADPAETVRVLEALPGHAH